MAVGIADDQRLCFIGDSFVQGTGDPAALGWCGRLVVNALRKGYMLTGYNLGVRRETSDDIARRWQAEAHPRLPAFCVPYVLFSHGVNDTTREAGAVRVSQERSIANTRRMLADASKHYRVALIGPPPVADVEQNQRITALSAAYALVAQDLGVAYLAVYEPLLRDEVWMGEVAARDGSHPGAGGYSSLAELVEQWPGWWFR